MTTVIVGTYLFVGGPYHLQWRPIHGADRRQPAVLQMPYPIISAWDNALTGTTFTNILYNRLRVFVDGNKYDVYVLSTVNHVDVFNCKNVYRELLNA